MKTFYLNALQSLKKEIGSNYDMIRKRNDLNQKAAPDKLISPNWPIEIQSYFKEVNGMDVHWRHFDFQDKPNVCGKINLQKADKLGNLGKDIVWFNSTPIDSPLRKFKIIDFFADEASVGFFEGDKKSEIMYLFLFDDKPLPLNINFKGYIDLLREARGFFYWQQVLVAQLTKKENQESLDFQFFMPKIFPDFKFDSFLKKFQKVKVK